MTNQNIHNHNDKISLLSQTDVNEAMTNLKKIKASDVQGVQVEVSNHSCPEIKKQHDIISMKSSLQKLPHPIRRRQR